MEQAKSSAFVQDQLSGRDDTLSLSGSVGECRVLRKGPQSLLHSVAYKGDEDTKKLSFYM